MIPAPLADGNQSASSSVPDEVTAWQRVISASADRGNEATHGATSDLGPRSNAAPYVPGPPTAAPPPPPSASLDTQESSVKNLWKTFVDSTNLPAATTGRSSDTSEFAAAMRAHNAAQALAPTGEAPPLSPDQAFRHGGWEEIRSRVRASLFRTGQPGHRVTAFDECGLNAWIEQNQDKPTEFRLKSSYCHDRLCTPCANERSFRCRDALLQQMANKPHTFITLTLSGKGEPLTDLVDRLYKHFRALRVHPTWATAVRGGGAFLEVKHNAKSGRWHPHLHIIADMDYLPQQDLCDAWRSITKDSFIVDIRKVRDTAGQARYVTKYASKPLNTSFSCDPALLDEAVVALKGRRLCLTFGTWYGCALDAEETDALDDDLQSVGQWQSIGGLYELHLQATSGNTAAQHALAAVRAYERANRFTTGPPG